MPNRLHHVALRVFRLLPPRLRRWTVRVLSPSFTVGAICHIERADGDVLLVRHAYREQWGIPGGLLQRGEAPAAAAEREVIEEVGLRIELIGEPALVVDPDSQRIDFVFRARPVVDADSVRARPCSPEIDEVGWFAADALPELQLETSQAVVALARSARSPQARSLESDQKAD
jgi:8-oxo-dGTP pyrophosphatase MutT (NUDIX family)